MSLPVDSANVRNIKVALAPDPAQLAEARGLGELDPQITERFKQAITDAGAQLVPLPEADGLIWLNIGDASALQAQLATRPDLKWVQLPWAGVETFAATELPRHGAAFTCAKASYGEQVGEHALVLALTCLRNVAAQARQDAWHPLEPRSLFRKRVTVVGAGGIAQTLISLLGPFDASVTVVRRSPEPVAGAARTVTTGDLSTVLPETDVLVLALALTPASRGLISERELALLPEGSIVVNVARGEHIDTEALTAALREGRVSAAGLDVTAPEPLPADHPLWKMDNVFISSHCADSLEFVTDKLIERTVENIECLRNGHPLVGQVNWTFGY
ncbi:MAG TPA: NAD(P)-dependent oxidoreductase [Mycobacteriales bacterium]|jgi:phosphoglycerate dehydrogenase-like enzyme|nr:NAD(P)-dependent oxidoreductase [Mycobacteriales bacterium]